MLSFNINHLGGKKADAKTTLMQEKASTYVFERVLKDNKTWKDVQAMMDDDVTMKASRMYIHLLILNGWKSSTNSM